jgi:hypothetical protein
MSEDLIKEILKETQLREKLDYTQVILYQLRICQVSTMLSERAFASSVITLLNLIPMKDKDEEFEKEIERARYVKRIRTGRFKGLGGAFIHEIIREEESYNYFAVLNAVLNLFRRKGLLWKEIKREYI